MTCGIYSVQSPTGKLYIGSSKNVERRWAYYKGLHCKGQTHLYNSLIKYGADNHTFQVIYECSKDELLQKEQMFMNFYKPELNCCKIAGKPEPKFGPANHAYKDGRTKQEGYEAQRKKQYREKNRERERLWWKHYNLKRKKLTHQ